ncbi:MAG: LiaG family protein [Bacillota bacterium]
MKKFFVLLFFVVGLFLLIVVTNTSWLSFGQEDIQADVTEKIDLIEIDVSRVSTTIIPENRTDVKAEYKGKGKVTVKESGNSIIVEFESKNRLNFLSFFNKKDLTIYIPEDYDRDMVIDSGSGKLTFSGKSKNESMHLENLSLNMSSGHVQLSHISTGHFEQVGSSGYVGIDSLVTKKGSFKMSSGKLNIKEYSGEVKATLSSGRFILQMEKLSDSVDLEVNSGFATIDLPSDAEFTLNGKISSGAITTDFSLTDSKEEKHKIEGKHGSGEHDLDLDVNSGKIDVK